MSEPNMNLIRGGLLEVNHVQCFDVENELALSVPPDETDWMMTLDSWFKHQLTLANRQFPVAILIPSDADLDDDPNQQIKALCQANIAFIAIDFPSYTDGRGYSLAQLLRNVYGWTGELRAVGDVMIDTVYYLARCGFDSFLVKQGHDSQLALEALNTFTDTYQKSYRQPIQRLSEQD
ncbi:DUF934 domain-containing protein [Methylotenera sp. L2L1]|uniref:DUF934 domain-containing protein n=1 Tax=Methylotenera sp. L2L1 TaxID=1502770 RepID=UPI0005692827|nr:DUF934 domain-containing protein [Methylotenera sp. L2L1]